MRKKFKLLIIYIILATQTLCIYAEIHTIKKGDTLYGLSKKYNIPISEILKTNNLKDASKIKIGQKIYIPNSNKTNIKNTIIKKYTIQKGDTIFGIAKKFGIKRSELLKINGLTENTIIKAGQKLKIPTKTAISSKPNNIPPPEDLRSYSSKTGNTKLLWPVKAQKISYISGKIYGVTIEGNKAEPVKAIASGKVVSSGPYRGYGKVVFIQSKTNHIYVYGGLNEITANLGDGIKLGETIGNLTSGNLIKAPQLYFMVYKKNKPIDPAKAPRGF